MEVLCVDILSSLAISSVTMFKKVKKVVKIGTYRKMRTGIMFNKSLKNREDFDWKY